MNSTEVVKENEQKFQDAYNKKDWDTMWICVYFACLNIGKSKCNGIRVEDLEGKCLDATIKIMKRIKEGIHPSRLSSYCYLFTIGELWSKKHRRWEEQSVSFDGYFDNYAYTKDDDVLCLCKSDYR